MLDFERITKKRLESQGEKWALITDNRAENALMLDNSIKNNFY